MKFYNFLKNCPKFKQIRFILLQTENHWKKNLKSESIILPNFSLSFPFSKKEFLSLATDYSEGGSYFTDLIPAVPSPPSDCFAPLPFLCSRKGYLMKPPLSRLSIPIIKVVARSIRKTNPNLVTSVRLQRTIKANFQEIIGLFVRIH